MKEFIELFFNSVIPIIQKKRKIFIINILQFSIIYVIIYQLVSAVLPPLGLVIPLRILVLTSLSILFHSIFSIIIIHLTLFEIEDGRVFISFKLIFKYLPRIFAINCLLLAIPALLVFAVSFLVMKGILSWFIGGMILVFVLLLVFVLQLFTDIDLITRDGAIIQAIKNSIDLAARHIRVLLIITLAYDFIFLLSYLLSLTFNIFPIFIQELALIILSCIIMLPFKITTFTFYLKHSH